MKAPCITAVSLAVCICLSRSTTAQDLNGVAAKIQLTAVEDSPGTLRVQLVDPDNKLATAKVDTEVTIDATAANGEVTHSVVLVKKGETSATTSLSSLSPGIVEAKASSPSLSPGGTLISIPAADVPGEGPADMPTAGAAPPNIPLVRAQSSPPSKVRRGGKVARNPASATHMEALAGQIVAAPPASLWIPTLQLRHTPPSPRADVKDPATIYAYLSGPAVEDLSIHLSSDLGPLTPDEINIPKGKFMGSATLVGKSPGTFKVYYDYSMPGATAPPPPLPVTFVPPVYASRIVPAAPSVDLFDSLEVAVELVNSTGETVATNTERKVSLSIKEGNGTLSSTEVTVPANSSRAVATFYPKERGRVQLGARSEYLPEQAGTILVTFPSFLVGLCLAGGMIGGVLAFKTEKGASANRIWIGIITGAVLYWAILFGLLALPSFPHGAVVNPATATIIPVIGGWLGTKVLTLLLNRFGWQV